MKNFKKVLYTVLTATFISCLSCQLAFAISESDVQAQVDAVGKETVAGNVLVWFLCAVAFLKVSQKIDSFMSSLGINVGHTGGNLLAEAMIAAKGIGGIRGFSSHYLGGGHSSSSTRFNTNSGSGGGFSGMGGGLSGIVSRHISNSAIKTATAPQGSPGSTASGSSSGIGGRMYTSSVSKGGTFANEVIGTVATGNFVSTGSMTGEKAAEALNSYMGHTALGNGAEHVPSYQNVEIGGGRITGIEASEKHPEGIAFGMYHTSQYTAPEGAHTTVHSADGASWYKQYAIDSVEKSPYMAPDGSIAYNESIVKKLPPAPRRKDKI